MKYAVIKIGGLQHKVFEGDRIEVNKISLAEGEALDISSVLLFTDERKLTIGRPLVKDIKVKAKVEKQFLGEKLDIFKFKAKTGYRRKMGFRPQRTLLRIEKIGAKE